LRRGTHAVFEAISGPVFLFKPARTQGKRGQNQPSLEERLWELHALRRSGTRARGCVPFLPPNRHIRPAPGNTRNASFFRKRVPFRLYRTLSHARRCSRLSLYPNAASLAPCVAFPFFAHSIGEELSSEHMGRSGGVGAREAVCVCVFRRQTMGEGADAGRPLSHLLFLR